ncbi:hypothetical protein MRX96_028140 [Rhipicephalus microplus]
MGITTLYSTTYILLKEVRWLTSAAMERSAKDSTEERERADDARRLAWTQEESREERASHQRSKRGSTLMGFAGATRHDEFSGTGLAESPLSPRSTQNRVGLTQYNEKQKGNCPVYNRKYTL